MTEGLYYLAVPYHGTEEEKRYRIEISLKATTEFLRQGIHLFSPVLYVNKIAEELSFSSLEKRRSIVMPYLLEFLKLSKGLILMEAEGWQKSWGIQQELICCNESQIPVHMMKFNQIYQDLREVLAKPLDSKELKSLLQP
jgi:hypothetical protein